MFIFLGQKEPLTYTINTYKLQMLYGKRKKLDSNTTRHDSIDVTFWKKQNCTQSETHQWLPRAAGGGKG